MIASRWVSIGVQINSSTSCANMGLGRGNNPHTELRSLMPSSRQEQLVVPAVVVQFEVAGRGQQPSHRRAPAQRQRVEQPHLHTGMGGQVAQQVVDLCGL